MAVSIPNLKIWFEKGHPNALNFEHTYLLTDFVAEYLFEKYGLKVLKKEDFGVSHSIFYILERNKLARNLDRKLAFNDQAAKQLLHNFRVRQQFVELCNRNLESHLGDAYLFGGSIFSQQLINIGLNVHTILNVLDNDPSKDGKRLYGSNLQIKLPSCISTSHSPLVIVDCGEYNEEIKSQLLALNDETRVLVFDTTKGISQLA
jgi:hypothetical protein